MPRRRWPAASALAIAAAATLSGCGGGSTSSPVTTPPVTVTITTTVTEYAPSPSTTSTVATTTAKPTTNSTVHALGPECNSTDLTASYLGSNGAAGTIELGFALTNTGSSVCHTYGWPGVEFLSGSGAALPTGASRTTTDMIGTTPPEMINLKAGQRASFRLMGHDGYDGGAQCTNAAQLQIFAPDDTVALHVTIGGGAPACGSTGVSPLQPGTSAYEGQ